MAPSADAAERTFPSFISSSASPSICRPFPVLLPDLCHSIPCRNQEHWAEIKLSLLAFLQKRERCSHTVARRFKDAWENILPPPHMIGMTAVLGPSLQRSFQPPKYYITLLKNISWSLHRLFELYLGTSTGIPYANMSLESK